MPPIVSLCLPNLNTRPFLQARMESIFAQTFTDWELIVCDSYSTDGSWEYFQKFKDDPRIHLFQVPREGIYAGWNECLRRATGKYVYFATSDDTMVSDCIQKLVAALDCHPELQLAVCDFATIDEKGSVLPDRANKWPREFYGDWMGIPHVRSGKTEAVLHACLGIVWWTMNAVMFRRSLLDRIGFFRTDRGSQADQEWELRAALASDIVYLPEKLASWRVHDQQATARIQPYNRMILDCLESVLQDERSGIPERWKKIPDWNRRLTHVCRMAYYDSFELYRGAFRDNPLRFCGNLLAALRLEPRLLIQQTLRGFKWSSEFSPDPLATARELITVFGCEWPPVKCNDK